MPVAQRRNIAADAKEYLVDNIVEDNELNTPEESLDYSSVSASSLPSGWDAALSNNRTAAKEKYTNEFRYTEEPQLVKFLESEPFASFYQHWLGDRPGKKSFNCLDFEQSDPDLCPLCAAGDAKNARKKIAFSIVNLSTEEPTVQMLVATPRTAARLHALNADAKTGPLDRLYWAVSKTGSGTETSHIFMPVKPRDLIDDWGVDASDVEAIVDGFEPLTFEAIPFAPRKTLLEIARG